MTTFLTVPVGVLIAEDDPLINSGVANQLRRLGYLVLGQAYDGPQAIELVRQCQPAVVLMDLRMINPDTGREDPQAGLKATRILRDSCPVAIVLLTAHESPELTRQASEAGASGYVVKPVCDNDLDRAITIASARFNDLLELRRLSGELQTRNQELSEAMARVKTLSGLLPICAGCKKIRDDQGYWQQVEFYLQGHSDATFTHGLCPDCCTRLYPEIFDKTRKP